MQSQFRKPPLVKKVIFPEFTLEHMYQNNPVLSKAELEYSQLLFPEG